MRVTPLRGARAVLLKCPACRLKCRPTAAGPDGQCPGCGHAPLLRIDVLRGRPAPSPAKGAPAGDSAGARD